MDISKVLRRQRAPKTTSDQYEVFLEFANRHPAIIDNKGDPIKSDVNVQQRWDELTHILNTSGRGPQRTTKEWQNTFSNWKNSIRHKMKCIMDGTSRTMLSELEGQALQLWDIVGFNGLPRYARKRTSVPPMRHNEHEDNASAHDESTQSSPACYSGGGVGGGGGGGNGSGVHMHVKEELLSNDYAEEQLLEQQRYDNNHSAASQTGMFNGSQLIDQGSAAGGSIEVTAVGEDDEADEYDEEENSNPLQETRAPSPLHTMVKRRKVDHHYHRYVPVQRRNGTSTERTAAGASTTADHNNDRYGGPQLIAESISKLADNVGQMAESIRDIAAAFTTTTHAAFELIRRQSEIIQGLIEK